ncbi:phage major capsid protein [Veillonella parvula]|uniref:phage major capsid protein n=1 Tax=Veillonella parvula TaxID=29466 RepID=UPI00241C35BB|nr:phage major capsid protein [Veillonella parvula]MBS6140053.1 phage major capsid protein [Veillonella parvula]
MNRIDEIKARKVEIRSLIDSADMETLKAFQDELAILNEEAEELRTREEIAKQLETNNNLGNSLNLKGLNEMNNISLESQEYRSAFMEYVTKGTEIPAEFRAAATSVSADNGAVIPTTVLNEIVTKLEKYGDILPRVRRVSYPAGVTVPTSATKFEAVWQNENAVGESQKMTTASISFTAYQLRCNAGVSFHMDVRSLAAFESALVKNVVDAMGKALEKAIIAGTGTGQPTGITAATAVAKVDATACDYATLVKAVKAVPSAYKKDFVFIMNEGTALNFATMVDKNGQPIINAGIVQTPQYRFLGHDVVLTDALPDFDAAATTNTVAVLFDLSKYMLNTSYEVDLYTYTDNATRQKVYDSIALVDGKVIDANGLVFINKK